MSQRVVLRPIGSRRSVRMVAAAAVVGLGATAIVAAGGGTAAAADAPNAQAVGRLVDGAVGGNPIQAIADVQDARATAPGDTSVQNPLNVKLLNAIELPLTNLIKLPTNPAVQAGVANQVASANLNGKSNGAAGAVANNGGLLLGDDAPSQGFATINLSGSALSGVTIPGLPAVPGLPTGLPGGGSLAALGGITATIGAVSSSVGTKAGGEVITPRSSVASLNLEIGSPALGALLSQLKGLLNPAALNGVLGAVPGLAAALALLPSNQASKCAFTAPSVEDLSLAGGGVVLSVDDAAIKINLAKLIKTLLDKDITDLDTSNFDLINFLVENLPKILSTGLANLVTSITDPLKTAFRDCVAVFPEPIKGLLNTVLGLVDQGQTTILGAVNTLSAQFTAAGSGPLGQLADGLKNIVDIGLNVQSGPGIQPRDEDFPYESNLEATPNQSTPVVEDQTLVRAVEINLLNVAAVPGGLPSLPGLPGLNSQNVKQLAGAAQAARPLARAPGDGAVNLALANSAAGPSLAAAPPTTPSDTVPPTVVPSTNVPTGIPAGQAGGDQNGGSPVLPLVAILTLLAVSGGAFWQLRLRGGSHQA